MVRRTFLVVTDWPRRQLTTVGKVTDCCTGGTEDHVGIFVPCCTPEEVARHSVSSLYAHADYAHESAKGEQHVVFDYMTDLRPRFQSWRNGRYYTPESRAWLYPILGVDAADVHSACLEAVNVRPRNRWWFRCGAVCWCCACGHCRNGSSAMAPSTCVALSLRIVARARSGSSRAFASDAFVFEQLGLQRFSCGAPCAPSALTGHTPRSGLEAMQAAGLLGAPVDGFAAAIAQCQAGGAIAVGGRLPLLPLMHRG